MKLASILIILHLISLARASDQFVLSKFNEMLNALEMNQADLVCKETTANECPEVHVSPWCKKQYDFLKNTKPLPPPSFAKSGKGKQLLFLGEEHGDEQAYSYYEKLLRDRSAGFDCLFIELPTVFQKNFDHKDGIVHDRGVFADLNKRKDPQNFSKIELTDFSYLELLESLVDTAKKQKVKVILVDSSEKFKGDPTDPSETMRRNETMARNIQKSFTSNQCSNGLSIQGNMHLFTRGDKKVSPIDQIMKENNQDLPAEQRIEIKKAFIYSAGSKVMGDAMGPCSWLNLLPPQKEAYFEGSRFSASNNLFPEKIHDSLNEKFGGVDQNIDFAVFLPLQMDAEFTLNKINRSLNASVPKKFTRKIEVSIEAKNVPMELRTNASTLNISNAKTGLSARCFEACQSWRHKMVVTKINLDQPTVDCQSFHPSWTNGATRAPVPVLNKTVHADCYCQE